MLTSLKRIIKSGWIDFRRNSGLSFATIFIMVLTISLATSLFLFQKTSQVLSKTVEEKVDMYIYFNEELSSENILEIQDELSKISSIRNMEYISREEALQRFISRHQDDQDLMESLEELGRNPLLSSLNIQAWEASQYAAISNYLDNSSFNSLIAKIDYQQKKSVIDRIASITSSVNMGLMVSSIVLAFIAVLVAFNTIKLAIYNSKEEIETMSLVGASNSFISGPFLVQGIIVGFLASVITLLIFGVGLFFLAPGLRLLLPGFNIFKYFLSNSLIIFSLQLAAGVGLGIIASWLAIRKYLKA